MRREIRKPVTEEDIRKWERGWAEMMVKIWEENILRLGIVDSGRLMRSLTHNVMQASDQVSIAHEFMLYGIYVARGVGSGYRKGNPGDLEFLDEDYRREHNLDKPRKKGPAWGGGYTSGKPRKGRDWFMKKYVSSMYVLAETERNLYGHAFMGNLSNVVSALLNNTETVGTSGTEVSSTLRGF